MNQRKETQLFLFYKPAPDARLMADTHLDAYLATRTEDACDQLRRYSGAVFEHEVADMLDAVEWINCDFVHMRDPDDVIGRINDTRAALDALERGMCIDRRHPAGLSAAHSSPNRSARHGNPG